MENIRSRLRGLTPMATWHTTFSSLWRGPHASFVWEDALIYMVMTDRFVNGNQSNDGLATGAAQEQTGKVAILLVSPK